MIHYSIICFLPYPHPCWGLFKPRPVGPAAYFAARTDAETELMEFLHCILYLLALSLGSFLVGRLLPKGMFHDDRVPFLPFAWEKEGRIYEKLRIRQWQNLVPDMSRILPWIMPSKQFSHNGFTALPRMIQETCVAEFIHLFLAFSGLFCIRLWKGVGGWVLAILYFLGNLPYVLIQRYNRPRLRRVLRRQEKRKGQ